MKFSIKKILAFLETEGFELAKETSQYFKFVLHKKIFLSGEDEIVMFLNKKPDQKEISELANRLSNIFENLKYYELIYAFSEDKTALTLIEFVNENKFGIKEYSDFLAIDFHASQITHFFDGFSEYVELNTFIYSLNESIEQSAVFSFHKR